MYSLWRVGVRLENHLSFPVIWCEQPESMIHLFSKPPTYTSVVRQRVSKCLNTGVSKVRSIPVSSHLLYRKVSKIKSVSHVPSTTRLMTTTARKAWCIVTSSKASVPWSIAVLKTTRSMTGKANPVEHGNHHRLPVLHLHGAP